MDLETLLYEKKDGIGVVTMNRPEKLNTWNVKMRQEFKALFPTVNDDPEVRVLVVTGAGDQAFTAGSDQTERSSGGAMPQEEINNNNLNPSQSLPMYIHTIEKPVIMSVNGVCVGGGLSWVTAADIAIASDRARFRVGHTRLGVGLIDSLGWLLPHRIGAQRAFEFYATNRIMDAAEAERIGLVLKVVPHESLRKETMDLAAAIAKAPPLGLRWTKKAMARSHTHSLPDYLEFERLVYTTCYYSEDSKEARKAFLEKREPKYQGR